MDIYATLTKMCDFVVNGFQTEEMLARRAAKQKLRKVEEIIAPKTSISNIVTEQRTSANVPSASLSQISYPNDYASAVRSMFPELNQDPAEFAIAFKNAYSDAISDEKMKINGSSDGVALSESDLENRAYDAILSKESKVRGEKWLRQNLKLYPAIVSPYALDPIFIYERHIKQ